MIGHELLSLYKVATQPRNHAFQADGSKKPQAKRAGRSPLTISRPIRYPWAFVKAEARKMESEANAIGNKLLWSRYHRVSEIKRILSPRRCLGSTYAVTSSWNVLPIDIKVTESRFDVACRETARKFRGLEMRATQRKARQSRVYAVHLGVKTIQRFHEAARSTVQDAIDGPRFSRILPNSSLKSSWLRKKRASSKKIVSLLIQNYHLATDYGSAEAGICRPTILAPKITRIIRNTLPCVYMYVRECVRIIFIEHCWRSSHRWQIRLHRHDSPAASLRFAESTLHA